jgi:uncharacterized membrane protein
MSDQNETPVTIVDEEISSDDKLWAMLAYVLSPIVPIIILLMEDKKKRPFIREHNMQALILGITYIILGFILSFTVVLACVPLLVWFYMIYLGFQAYQGQSVKIPVITDLVKNQGWA